MPSLSNQPEPSPADVSPDRPRNRRLLILLEILAAIALGIVLFWGISHIITSVLVVLIAALIAYAIVPVIELFNRVMPRPLAILLAYLLVIIILGVIIYSVVNTAVFQISALIHNVSVWMKPDNSGKLPILVPILDLLHKFGLTDARISDLEQQILTGFTNFAGSLASGLVPLLSGVAGGLLNVLLTVVISIYLLVDGPRAITWVRKAAPKSRRSQIGSTIDTLQHVLGGYIRGQILLSALIGFLVGTGLFIIGFPYAVLMGVLTFITEFIPVLGTIFAGTVAVLLALTQGWVMTVIVLAFFILVHIFEGYFLAPRLIGKAIHTNPAIMLIALMVGSELFGPLGAIFAAPTAGLLQALFVAIWIQYRQTHKEEFVDDEQESSTKPPEELPVMTTTPTYSAAEDSTKDK